MYRYQEVLGFISTEGAGSTEPGVPYLSFCPENYSNVSIFPVLLPHMIFEYLSACNSIYNHKRMWKSEPSLDKYWVTHSLYFRLATTVSLDMEIVDEKILFCCGISYQSVDKTISIIYYNDSTFYY